MNQLRIEPLPIAAENIDVRISIMRNPRKNQYIRSYTKSRDQSKYKIAYDKYDQFIDSERFWISASDLYVPPIR